MVFANVYIPSARMTARVTGLGTVVCLSVCLSVDDYSHYMLRGGL